VDVYEKLLYAYKFDTKRQAAEPIAKMMSDLPVPEDALLCPLPTGSSLAAAAKALKEAGAKNVTAVIYAQKL
jgi:predicted amidophosphoribosyltransferase